MIKSEFERIGKRLFSEHLVGGNFGNISVRSDDGRGFYITGTGSYLDETSEPVFVPLEGNVPNGASSEYRVHLEVYRYTDHMAIVHVHPPHSVAASLVLDEIVTEDSEGKLLCPIIPVVSGDPGTQDLADQVSEVLCSKKLCIAKGHGTFAGGKNLDEAYLYSSLAEHSCKVLWLLGRFL